MSPPPLCNTLGGVTIVTPLCAILWVGVTIVIPPLCNTLGGVTIVTPALCNTLGGGDNCHPPPVQYFGGA